MGCIRAEKGRAKDGGNRFAPNFFWRAASFSAALLTSAYDEDQGSIRSFATRYGVTGGSIASSPNSISAKESQMLARGSGATPKCVKLGASSAPHLFSVLAIADALPPAYGFSVVICQSELVKGAALQP